MTVLRRIFLSACVLALFLGAAPAALGDWYPGEPNKMHYPQLPDPFGWDICVNCQWVADDFECSEDGPIEDIHFWVSWLDDWEGWDVIQNWDISIWSDAIGGPGACGMQPGTRLWTWQGDGNVQTRWETIDGDQGWHCPDAFWSVPNNHANIYQVNITNIQEVFTQEAGTTYWLVIKVWLMTEPPPVPGWKTSTDAWRCRALWSLDPDAGQPWSLVDTGSPMGTDPVYHDMAFVITGPEEAEVDHGDAPDGDPVNPAIAYPSLGVPGAFPTCRTVLGSGYIEHGLGWARFEPPGAGVPGWDAEADGDAGLCPPPGCFPTYDDDECFMGFDAGLMFPDPYTIDNLLNVVPCPAGMGTALGYVCNNGVWGQDIDIWVNNQMPVDGWVNVLADWQQDGVWAGSAPCPGAAAPEYILRDLGVPVGYTGPLSGLLPFPTSFLIGPNSGYVWFRFTITERQINDPSWDGRGSFEDGETEDYLLRVDACQPPPDLDFGDAPDPTYPTWLPNGARHIIGGPYFCDVWGGDAPDSEQDGQPDAWATGDDLDADGDDEDGVSIPVLVQGVPANISLYVCGSVAPGAWVQIWIDMDGSGSWEAAEQVYNGVLPDGGPHLIPVMAPIGSVVGTTFARCRISSGGGLWVTGQASDGEVEDHVVTIEAPPVKPPVPHLKWSQPPIEWDPNLPFPLYCGWDQESWTTDPCNWWLAVADDFRCLGTMPITSVHWWASHVGWQGDDPPDPQPSAWRIGFWSNVPANATGDPPYSYPEKLLWQVEVPASRVQIEWSGMDQFPDWMPETCFQYYVKFDGPEWFWQSHYELETQDNVFWISIVAIYPSGTDPVYEWGWKTRPWSWMDDAVTFDYLGRFEPGIVLDPATITPIENPITQKSMDVAFELDTDPCYIKWEQPFTGIRRWPHYEDERSMGIWEPVTVYKWWQGPDLSTSGLDVDMTYDIAGTQPAQILADDFECTSSEPITDVHVWCSWLHDEVFDPENVMFTLSIHDDIPAGSTHSMPGDVRWWRDFQPGEFMAWPYATDLLEGWWSPCTGYYDPDGDTICWEYDFYIDPGEAFVQEGSPDNPIVYWLDVQAQPFDEMERIGWKTSNEPWNDDGVWAVGNEPYVGAWQELLHPMSPESLDLAFAITAEQEEFFLHSLVADDWPCDNNKPVTAVVWWGSYIGYSYQACQAQLAAPPVRPDYFWLAIWGDVPAVPGEPTSYSHPNDIIWEYATRDYDEVLVGYDKHPHGAPNEPVFRYSVRVPKEHWFFQKEPNSVYWLSVVAVWDVNRPNYDWGWTNHEYEFNDDAVTGYVDESGAWVWAELFDQTGESEDMSFILFTEPDCLSVAAPEYADWILWGRPKCWCYPRQCRGDIDGIQTGPFHVAIPDLGIFKLCFNQFVLPPGCICADLDHMQTGPFRVAIPDLTIFKTYFNQFVVPQCDQLPIYTGPYNFWTSP